MSEDRQNVYAEIDRANTMVALGHALVVVMVFGCVAYVVTRMGESKSVPPSELAMPVTVEVRTLAPKQIFRVPNVDMTYVVLRKDETTVWAYPISNPKSVKEFSAGTQVEDFPGFTVEVKELP